jgi:SAM-dependent methyltransferase
MGGIVQSLRKAYVAAPAPLKQAWRAVKTIVGRVKVQPALGTFARDDYDWRSYRIHYERDLADVALHHTQKLESGDFLLRDDNSIILRQGLKPLHPNHSCLYETLGILAPNSVIEVGCGGGDHLHNLGLLYPSIRRQGFDRSRGQLALLKERSPHLAPLVKKLDITLPLPAGHPTADVVYTQAVIMHIHAQDRHLDALQNMFRMATKHVVLMENWWRHWFRDEIAALHERGLIDWPSLQFYFRRENGRPKIMIISKEILPFEPLADYRQLLDGMEWSPPPGTFPSDGRYVP